MNQRTIGRSIGAIALAGAFIAAPLTSAQAYTPAGGVVYEVPANQACLKGRGNCAIYGKMTQLPNGRLIMSFEQSTVAASGTADGQTLPIYKSDDYGDTWQKLSEVAAPAYISDDPKYDPYVSNWTNPNLYVLPQDVGNLKAGTLLLASVVSGDDEFYKENKQRDPNWIPNNDGDRSNVSIALYASNDNGASWDIVNIIAEGGWQGGSAGAGGQNIAAANTTRQVDPLWEPHLMVHDDHLVAYYSDENDYLSYDTATGRPTLDPANDTAQDSGGQILAHRTWDGTSASWSEPVVDIPGTSYVTPSGKTQIGGGRPGMTYVAPTTDDRWLITYEYFGGGDNARYVYADNPLEFYKAAGDAGTGVSALPVEGGSRPVTAGGSPVTEVLPDGRIVYNAAGSGDVWVNESGRSDGAWTQYRMPVGGGYSRALQYVEGTGRIVTSQSTWGGAGAPAVIRHAEVDLGDSDGAYYRLVNKATGQVLGTGGRNNDASFNGDTPDVRLEAAADTDTQYWRIVTKSDGTQVLLNKSGGREASIWTGNATPGQRVAQWVDNRATGTWNVLTNPDGTIKLQAVRNTALFATGAANAPVTIQAAATDGSQDWTLEYLAPEATDLTSQRENSDLVAETKVEPGATLQVNAAAFAPNGDPRRADTTGRAFLLGSNGVVELGDVEFDAQQNGTINIPTDTPRGIELQLAVLFNDSELTWDTLAVATAPVDPQPEPEPEPQPEQPQQPETNPGQNGGGTTPTSGSRPTAAGERDLASTGADITAYASVALAMLAGGGALLLRQKKHLRSRS